MSPLADTGNWHRSTVPGSVGQGKHQIMADLDPWPLGQTAWNVDARLMPGCRVDAWGAFGHFEAHRRQAMLESSASTSAISAS